jgi:RHS repeat-associated protein
VHTLTENARGLPAAITDSGAGVTPLQQTYTYDADGNPTAISDAANSAQNRSMTYDTLDRLVSATVGYQGSTPTTFSYDVLDNLTAISQGTHLKTLQYNTADQLSALIDSAAGTTAFTYDAQGNLAAKGGQAYAFDYGNRLRWASGRESYAYDALGRRVLATASSGASILSLYSSAGPLLYQQDNRSAVSHAYLYLGSQLIATEDYPFGGGSSTRYEHSDAQGSVVAETNASRAITKTSVYASWGGLLNHTNDDAPGYTGHLQDSLTDLTYMQQRYYDPSVGRFLSMDPVGVNTTGGGNFNRYWYAADNPYANVDPDGEAPTQPVAAASSCNAGSTCRRSESEVTRELNRQEAAKAEAGMPKSKIATLATIVVTAARGVAADIPEIVLPAVGGIVTYVLFPITLVVKPGNLAPSDCGDGRCGMMSSAQDRPPPNSKPIDETPWSGDHGKIKGDLGLRGKGVVVIDPGDNVWVQHPDGSWSNAGPAGNFTGSGKPSGRRGKDRDGH